MNVLKVLLAAALLIPAGTVFSGGPGPGFGPGPVPVPEAWVAVEKTYYLTHETHQGNDVLSACAAGYHFASAWELLDVSNLSYNFVFGQSNGDSGFGPPSSNTPGWLRTGTHYPNCNFWTTIQPGYMGLVGSLEITDLMNGGDGWNFGEYDCGDDAFVWCVSDPVIIDWPFGRR